MPATTSISPHRLHGDIDVVSSSELVRARITSVGVPKNTDTGIAGEDALEAALGIVAPIGHDNHARVLRETYADATAVVN